MIGKPAPLPADADTSRSTYLAEIADLLWPAPAEVRTSASRRQRQVGGTSRYLLLPTPTAPKLLIPAHPRRIAAAALRSYNTGAPAREQRMIAALALGLRIGLGALVPGSLTVNHAPGAVSSGIESRLGQLLGRRVYVSLHIGPARAVRKPVLQVLDQRGKTVAFAKLGVDGFTSSLVRAEATTLAELATRTWSALAVPQVLHAGTWGGQPLLVLEAFPRGSAARGHRAELARAADEVARARGLETTTLANSRYRRRLADRVQATRCRPLHDEVAAGIAGAIHRAGAAELSLGCAHGDWAPWNMTIRNGRVLAWDWERFEHGVPVGFDTVHFAVQESVVVDGRRPVDAFGAALARASQLLSGHGMDERSAVLVVWLYALDLALRYLEDDETAAGHTPMSRVAEWLPVTRAAAEARIEQLGRP